MKKLLAIDGNSILNRAYYGIRPLTTKNGLFTNAVYGLINTVSSNIESIQPDYAAVAFDLKAPTFRHKRYDGYKAKRKGMPEELAMQLPYAKSVLSAMGFSVLQCEGYEADDILGTLARISDGDGVHAYILTGDRDALQLITDNVSVLLVKNSGTELYTPERFAEEYGTTPDKLVDIKALMGDSSDNIPGVPGIGEKTALKLICDHGSLDGVYSYDMSDLTKSVKEKLVCGKESAYLSYELAKIFCQVPCIEELSSVEYTGIDKKALYDLFTELEFGAFIRKFSLNVTEVPMMQEQIEFPRISLEELNKIKGKTLSCILSDESDVYVNGENFSAVCTFDPESEFFTSNNIICDDSKRLYSLCGNINIVFDVYLAGYVLNAGEGDYSTSRLALSYLGVSAGASYSERSIYAYKLYDVLDKLLCEQMVSSLYYDIELPLSRVLAKMEKNGFRIDTNGIKEFGEKLDEELSALTERIYMLAGQSFNINSTKQLGVILFEQLKLPVQKKSKTGYSTNVDVLEKLRPYHPIIDEILEYRSISKLKNTYTDGLLKVTDENGIIHTSFNQTVTSTGRLSSTEPNLQNIPVRTQRGRELRRFFIPKSDEYTLIDADYSQIELRILAAIAEDDKMIDAFANGVDIHSLTASGVFGVDLELVTDELRRRAKAVNFGIVYGIGDFSLAQDIGVSKNAAKKYIESYLANYPAVAAYLTEIKRQAKETGYVTTLFGRRRYIPELSSSKKLLVAFGERVAMNSPIQGTAADIIKLAMVNTQKALEESGFDAHLILQVHDELIIESKRSCADKVAELLKREMENVIQLPVKLSVEVKSADSWYYCK